jgi:Glycine zipper
LPVSPKRLASCSAKEELAMAMTTNCKFTTKAPGLVLIGLLLVGCSGGPLTTREKGAGIGALGGAAAGGLIGAAVGRPGTGAAIGGGLGLGAGALIGDQLQGQENENYRQDQQIRTNQQEIERQQHELNRLKQQSEY